MGVAPMTEKWSYMCHIYVLSDSLTCTKPNPFSHFSMGLMHSLPTMIVKISTAQDNSEVLPLSGDPILPSISHMNSTLSLSSDKPHLKFSTHYFTVKMVDYAKLFPTPFTNRGLPSKLLYSTG